MLRKAIFPLFSSELKCFNMDLSKEELLRGFDVWIYAAIGRIFLNDEKCVKSAFSMQ